MMKPKGKFELRLFSDNPENLKEIQKALAMTNIEFEVFKRTVPISWRMLKEGLL